MRLRRLAPAALLLSGALLLGGCATLSSFISGGDQAVRDVDSGEVTDGGTTDVFTLAVGDCLNDLTDAEVTEVPVVPCSEPHDSEVYFEFSLDDGEFPGATAVTDAADQGCYDAFAAFVGLAYEDSVLVFGNYVPTQESWESGNDRLVSCMIGDPEGPTTGSLAGAAR
ncbi:septum formation family protein [Microbacterium sp. W1N]|uniref:septum formation family protein n=1 Tax=Microbacterium festucae TaxID=2977531 RepID=UPI0021BF4C57|nr:septum formation family protein [Microbacterium festucae]MCT9819366.1 septum formation family protein [Microbacterium festucae]